MLAGQNQNGQNQTGMLARAPAGRRDDATMRSHLNPLLRVLSPLGRIGSRSSRVVFVLAVLALTIPTAGIARTTRAAAAPICASDNGANFAYEPSIALDLPSEIPQASTVAVLYASTVSGSVDTGSSSGSGSLYVVNATTGQLVSTSMASFSKEGSTESMLTGTFAIGTFVVSEPVGTELDVVLTYPTTEDSDFGVDGPACTQEVTARVEISAAEGACAAGQDISSYRPSIDLDLPSLIAKGGEPATVWASADAGTYVDSGPSSGHGTISLIDESTGRLIATAPAKALGNNSQDEYAIGSFDANERIGSRLEVVLKYPTTEDDDLDAVACTQEVTALVKLSPGLAPQFSIHNAVNQSAGDRYVDFVVNPALQGDCDTQLGGYTQKQTDDLTETWSRAGTSWSTGITPCYKLPHLNMPPGLSIYNTTVGSQSVYGNGYEFSFEPAETFGTVTGGASEPVDYTYHYKFTVTFDRRTLFDGAMTAYFNYQAPYRVEKGTDAFVNYCINGLHKIYSSGGVLYCNHPAVTVQYVHVS
jgi:hypothetical protein